MDSLTHVLVGAAIGNAVLGRRVGNKAMLWGAAVASIPDIDVPIGMLMNDLAALTFHRGITHSLLFIALITPLLGWLLSRLHRGEGVDWKPWSLLCGLALLSHLLLDSFTSYGIQLLQPFSDHVFAIASISVIDPLLTLPLLLAVPVIVFLRRDRRARQWLGYAALGLSGAYLAMTVVNKLVMHQHFERELAEQDIAYQRLFVKPTLFNNVLWRGIAETGHTYEIGFASLLDADGRGVDFLSFDKNHYLLEHLEHTEAVRRLQRVSWGYYKVEQRDDDLYVHDMRYGKGFEWMQTDRDFVFSYRLLPPDPARDRWGIEFIEPHIDRERERDSLGELIDRILGRR